tara:strand:- start:24888 stop:25706 length:819 start_codon:yes stop_codon:yes gene_type:complete
MKKICVSSLFTILFIAFNTSFITAQSSSDNLYLKVDYFKAPSDQIGNYLHVEQELWKPVHQARLDSGIILGWSFYSTFVAEPDAAYNYIAVNVFDDFDKIDYFGLNEIVAEIYPEKDLTQFYEQTRDTREVIRTEIWRVNDIVIGDDSKLPIGNYITKNFFDSRGGSGGHEEIELDFWGNIHEVRVEQNILNSWAMYTLYYPAGDVRNYTYSTVDYYEKLSDMIIGAGLELARIAYPDASDEELSDNFTRTGEARSLYKTEIWKLLDSVGYD